MLSQDEAIRRAADHLQDVYRDDGYTIVMQPELTVEYRTVWAVRFDTREHLDSGDITKAPLVRVLVVPKDGAVPHFPPTARPLSEYVEQLEATGE